MNCKACNAPIADDAAFCCNCGARTDGKKTCVKCGKLYVEGQKFCSYCGLRLDGMTTCKSCGKEYKGNFCPACGRKNDSVVLK